MTDPISERDALVIVDVQNDFCAGGALAVPDGDGVVAPINALIRRFAAAGAAIVATQDWHPERHASFASEHPGRAPFEQVEMPYGPQTLWPDHCIQGTKGARFHPDLDLTLADLVVRKGFRRALDSYSAFLENDGATPTGLAGYLRERGVARGFFAGLATDFCVGWSVRDARKLGFEAVLVEDACRAIDLEGSLAAALTDMERAGATRAAAESLAA